jgi:flagellar basal body P-ring formation protein FlgA
MKFRFFCVCLTALFCFVFEAKASFQEDLESRIAKEQNLENVIVTFQNGRRFSKDDDIAIQNIKFKDKLFQAECTNKLGKSIEIAGRFEEAFTIVSIGSNIKSGHLISEDDIEEIKIPASKNTKNLIINRDELVGKEARHNINARKLITKSDIRNQSVISKGDDVKILFIKNSLSIESKGQALESGGQDELIRVKNLDSNKTLQARVIDSQTVLLGNS